MDISQVDVDGGRLAVEVRGSGPLVVCSPAMGDERDAFGPLADRLAAAGYRIALTDLRGHGDSDIGFVDYGDTATAADLIAVIEALGGGPAVIAGASLSAAAAIIAAGTRPDLVTGLVLLGPFARNGNAVMGALLRGLLARPWGPAVWRGYSASLWPGLGEDARVRATHLSRRLARPGRWAAFVRTTRADHSVVAPFLPRVRARTLVVMGAADPDWKDPAAEAEWLAGELSAQVLVVPGVGHAPMLEAPDAVAPAVLDFLGEARDAARWS
ncbi:alpha/beta hydrolase [Microbacterium sp. 5K110]|jgi:pimeloyl-ACP methyl ester carboxylesterase|uniref:alpha/beta fold hydrolase n=1 Tax=unclassified Microbacterium TaxID=2609290 RepID=UPI0010FD79DC|nr:alpha/beta hydrolase [Microbacterium sp. 5K110]TLF30296.1 alpha/beta hydrolase [Microbacterium sp. 5K110]